jgi:hypothetical protein
LFFPDEGRFVFSFGFENDEGKPLLVEQQKVDEALRRLLKIIAQGIEILRLYCDARLKLDVGGAVIVWKESPASRSNSLLILIRAAASFIKDEILGICGAAEYPFPSEKSRIRSTIILHWVLPEARLVKLTGTYAARSATG